MVMLEFSVYIAAYRRTQKSSLQLGLRVGGHPTLTYFRSDDPKWTLAISWRSIDSTINIVLGISIILLLVFTGSCHTRALARASVWNNFHSPQNSRKLLHKSDNNVLRTLAYLNQNHLVAIASKCGIVNYSLDVKMPSFSDFVFNCINVMSFFAFFVFIVYITLIVCVQYVFFCCIYDIINDE